MENSIYIGLSRQMALRTNMDIVANNIANMNTSGFRGQNPVFREYISDPVKGDDPLSFVSDYGQYQMSDPGPLTQTGNDLDVALVGKGFITVQRPDGSTGYTRDGSFHMRRDGTLVTSTDMPVMGGGSMIVLPANATQISIDENGVISDEKGPVAQLGIVEFANVQTLKPAGHNAYISSESGIEPKDTTVAQGFVEGSNVNPVVEMTRMIEILRNFQSTQNMLKTEHDRMREAIQKLTES
ncbi:MAG: flagellar basal-body rod protein FlgF [Alphaproteobacteria bacterium]|nr:flagellar basal-body rod protein FlgF [Alphaproteobacteria bacterium]